MNNLNNKALRSGNHQNISRLIELDGLRGVSILLVFLSHAWLGHILPGGFGVTIFFFISGYIITTLMYREWDLSLSLNIKKFYLRRFFRLIPVLALYLAISAGVMSWLNVATVFEEFLATLFYVANYYEIYVGFTKVGFYSPLGIVWSLSIEEVFYIFWPFIFICFVSGFRRFLFVIIVLLVVVLFWRLYLVYFVGLEGLPHYRIYKSTDTRFDSILYGSLFAIVSRSSAFVTKLNNAYLFFFGILLILVSLLLRDDGFRETFRYSLQGLGLFFTFHHLLFSRQLICRILRNAVLQFFGKISYSLYLYHWLVFVVVAHLGANWSFPLKMFVYLSVSIVASWMSYTYIELYSMKIGRRIIGRLSSS